MFASISASLVLASLSLAQAAPAGKAAPAKSAAPAKAATNASPAAAKFKEQLVQWKELIKELNQIRMEYRAAKAEDRPKLFEKFNDIVKRGFELEKALKNSAESVYAAAPNQDEDVTAFMVSMAKEASQLDNYEEALRVSKILIDHGFDNKQIYNLAGVAAFNTNEYELARKYLKIAEEAGALDDSGKLAQSQIDAYEKKWEREKKFREADAKANLPRVKLKTSKGDIVVELFENEAPNTVANFINLVEKKYYDGTPFHRVLAGFMAQGGDPTGTGKGGPGYTIACECTQENHREHFRGTLSMAHRGRDTGGSQFFLNFVPTSQLDGKHTAFGRVVEGSNVLSEIMRRDPTSPNPADPDKIIEATVVRKGDHPYEPKKTPDATGG